MSAIEAMRQEYDESKKRLEQRSSEKAKSRSCSAATAAAGVMKMEKVSRR